MRKEKDDLTKGEIKQILDEFGAKSEDELVEIVEKTWNLIKCKTCKHSFDLTTCSYTSDGDPICPRCHYG